MQIHVRQMDGADRQLWATLRACLWPEEPAEQHAAWVARLLESAEDWGFVAETHEGGPLGFAELSVRKHANGCDTAPVPFLEAVWVKEEFRRQGVGRKLVQHAADFAVSRGFREMGSDALIDNVLSHACHLGWGFSETERVVYFRRSLVPAGPCR